LKPLPRASAKARVASSNGKIPFLPPASIAMFVMVNRHAIGRCATPSPAYSMARYSAPSPPIFPMM
jgi:hypothetical protein